MCAIFVVFLLYSSALHTSFALVQGLSFRVTTCKSTLLKVNGITEDILSYIFELQPALVYWQLIRQKKLRESTSDSFFSYLTLTRMHKHLIIPVLIFWYAPMSSSWWMPLSSWWMPSSWWIPSSWWMPSCT